MGYNDKLRSIANRYMGSGQAWPASTRTIAAWAIRNELWKPQPSDLIGQCADQLARAMREEFIHDPQGRTIRAKHAVREHGGQKNLTLWGDIRTAPRIHMLVAFQQRRQQIVGDCSQLKADVDSYNQNWAKSEPIQMVFDFRRDVEERQHHGAA